MSEHPRLDRTLDTSEPEDLPVRSQRDHVWCLNRKHRWALANGGSGYHHALRLSTQVCARCWARRQPRARWLVVDHRTPIPADQVDQSDDRGARILVVGRRPAVRAGVGRLEVRVRGIVVAVTDVQLCGVDHRGVVCHIEVDPAFRRRGFGTLLLDAAQARGPGYHWSTVRLDQSEDSQDFWTYQDPAEPLHLGEPHYCTHMREANGEMG
ncbi:GNAT family N-acetyltransferase [Amycolatopsis mediterranei]|uniref:GNAT family N-acetyltransferase n=1 Tax=Amycolatopsis mediterranei TaxID=33910 RepID=UPI001E294A03|nr:GNAT family N-acetyltransferase [Amycolatopsis mediterranei]UZF72921.1 GNAT family N-acetyltransferase [Amycolatopsis mediterranei]